MEIVCLLMNEMNSKRFITTGLGLLVDTLLVTNASSIKAMNSAGCQRMQLNLLVLQQNLKNIEPDVVLRRSAQYFDLFLAGPDQIIEKAKEALQSKNGSSSSGTNNPDKKKEEQKEVEESSDAKKGSENGDTNAGREVDEGEGKVLLPFSHEELKFLVELCHSEALSSDRREAAMQARRQLNDRLLRLSEFTWQT